MGIIFFAELAIGVLVYLYKEKVRDEVKKNLKTMIETYRDDEDLQDLIDWIQRDWVCSFFLLLIFWYFLSLSLSGAVGDEL